MTPSPQLIQAAATAIANARGMRRGVPEIVNILDVLPPHLRSEVLQDGEAAARAALALMGDDVELRDCDLSIRSYNCLRSAGVRTVIQLSVCTPSRLLKIRAFGKRNVRECERLLERHGLTLRSDPPAAEEPFTFYTSDDDEPAETRQPDPVRAAGGAA